MIGRFLCFLGWHKWLPLQIFDSCDIDEQCSRCGLMTFGISNYYRQKYGE